MRLSRYKGFTLIEVLIVILIMGIVVSIAVINPGNFQLKRTEAFTGELEQILKTTRQQAVLQSAVYGVSFYQDHYEFYRFDMVTNKWIAMREIDKFWKDRLYPSSVEISVVPVESRDDNSNDENVVLSEDVNPQIIFFPTGEISPFVLTINLNHRPQFQIVGKFSGDTTLNKIN